MSASTTAGTSPPSAYTPPAFWERLWRTAGIQSVGLFIIGYAIYGYQPHIGASTDALAAFYEHQWAIVLIADRAGLRDTRWEGLFLRAGHNFAVRTEVHEAGVKENVP